ncbi:Thioesterase superfamily protein [compost metagenome]
MGLVAMAAKPNESVVTTNLNLHYMAPIAKGEMKVTAEIVHSSGRMITTQGHVYNEEGQLCAFGTGTFRIVEWRGTQ